MTILLAGGGSGGHITPLLAVAESLKNSKTKVRLVYIGHKHDKLKSLPQESGLFDTVHFINAGKLRRYHGEGLKQLLDVPTILKNIRDIFYMIVGIFQSIRLLSAEKPDIIFIKGGFVGLPVGLAARIKKYPYVTHDSDTVPGLANKLISKQAAMHAVAMDPSVYDYPPDRTVRTGIPISANFKEVDKASQAAFKEQMGLDPEHRVILVTGGGLGAERLNNMVTSIAAKLFKSEPQLHLIHVTGKGKASKVESDYKEQSLIDNVTVVEFTTELFKYSGAADLIVTRAGATTLAEFALQNKPCIVVPNPMLTSGHQTKNARVLESQKAVVVVTEGQTQLLLSNIQGLLNNPGKAKEMATRLNKQSVPNSARLIADLLIDLVNNNGDT